MKKNVLLAFAVFVSVLGSCNKAPTPDPELGEFQTCSSLINLSQKNKFNESLFCNKDWVLYGARYEKYHDGVLQDSKTVDWAKEECFFQNDHTVRFGDGVDGEWLYSHNYLMWVRYGGAYYCYGGAYYCYEVISVDANNLQLRVEDVSASSNRTPYYKDNSGSHTFRVFEYHAK